MTTLNVIAIYLFIIMTLLVQVTIVITGYCRKVVSFLKITAGTVFFSGKTSLTKINLLHLYAHHSRFILFNIIRIYMKSNAHGNPTT